MASTPNKVPSSESNPKMDVQPSTSEVASEEISDNDEQVVENENTDEVKHGSNTEDLEPDTDKPKDNCEVNNLQNVDADDRTAECSNDENQNRSCVSETYSKNHEMSKRDELVPVDTAVKQIQNEKSGKVDKEKKVTDSKKPANENQNAQSDEQQSKQENVQPLEREKQSSKPSTGNTRNDSQPNENYAESASGVQSDQKSIDTFGSKGCFHNNSEFIRKEQPTLKNIQQLNLSAQFVQAGLEIVLNNNGCQLVVDDDFIAEVKIVQPELLDQTRNFQQAKDFIFNKMRIETVLFDKCVSVLAEYREAVVFTVENFLKHSSVDRMRGVACFQLTTFIEQFSDTKKLTYIKFFQQIFKNSVLRNELKEYINIANDLEKNVSNRIHFLMQFGYLPKDDPTILYERMQKGTAESMKNHKRALLEITPATLKSQLENISRERFMLITVNDMKRFADMRSVLNKEIFSKPLQDMEHRWIRQIESIKTNSLNKEMEITNDMFFFVCKSLQELILEISELTGHEVESLLKRTDSGWRPISEINWKEENLLTKSLERQYFFMFDLLTHFAFTPNYGKKPFEYKFQYFTSFEKKTGIWDGIKQVFSNRKKSQKTQLNHLDLPDEKFVWYCLVDDVLCHVLPKNSDTSDTEKTLESYLKLIRETKIDQLERLRVATHYTIRFIVQVIPYMSSTLHSSSVDRCILQKQMAIISSEETAKSNKFRDLVNVFNSYWKFRRDVLPEIVSKMPLPEMILLKDQLLQIVSAALNDNVVKDRVVAFFRTYEEFLINLNEVPFDWFIKGLPKVNMQEIISSKLIEMVDNKLNGTVNATYRVVDSNKFATFCTSLGDHIEVPLHFKIVTMKMLLNHVQSQLKKESWTSGERLTEEDQLTTTCDLFSALQQTLLFMNEQPEYASFAVFYDDIVKPFASLIETSSSRLDFSSRVQLLKQSYWFFRKQNDIDLEKALELYKSHNISTDTVLLKKLYQRYLNHFEKFMQATIGKESFDASIQTSENLKKLIPKNKLFTTWDSNFKQNDVPQILAGLAAVWSILVSKDVSSSGKYLSPHCIQILCVLRLLSSDKVTSGIDKHLAQVLTGQGKSLILALVATFLALTGHKVDIGCYSRYLVERDRDSFNKFYSMFSVNFKISYGTLDKMIEKFINPHVDGQSKGLRHFVNNLLHHNKENEPSVLATVDFSKSVLLIDEVDVFFTEQFYGNIFMPSITPVVEGIDKIQEFIWKTVCEGQSVIEYIVQLAWRLIQALNFPELNSFINRNENYELLTSDCIRKSYNNRSLLDEQLHAMVKCAVAVHQDSSQWSKFKLNSSGLITYNTNGEYVTHTIAEYRNVFHYFRLKKNNFVSKIDGDYNYGYLNIACGSLSYAMLPFNYPLIVGVSGTLTALNAYEKHVIEKMNGIEKLTIVPSFFGGSNLRFDTSTDFTILTSDSSWKQYIFSHANQMVSKNRAVLVFFETDFEIDAFNASYGGQFDRLNVLTENTDDKEKYIDEAGIAQTVTLATRGMGRGVDYKSGVVVEKNGGVHVIQTFFSMDIKEEAQIKGRTARQDNKGSYEIVLCQDKMCSPLKLSTSYSSLAKKRQELGIEANKMTSDAIEKNKLKHNATLNYLKSFFRGW